MPLKDPEQRREYEKEWHRQNANWLREYRLAYYKTHQAELAVKQKQKYQKDLAKSRRKSRERAIGERARVKYDVLCHYSNDGSAICVKCGFSDIRALSIDHIKSNGREERGKMQSIGSSFYRWLRRNSYPEGYQTLCMNCQFIKRVENKECAKELLPKNP